MALKPLMLVIGGAVASTVGTAFKTVESGIQKLEAKGNKAKVLKSTIGETIKLREEWKRANDSGAAGADKLLRKLNGNLEALRNQGVEVGRLSREYQRLGREARAADLQVKGHQQVQAHVGSGRIGTVIGVGLALHPDDAGGNETVEIGGLDRGVAPGEGAQGRRRHRHRPGNQRQMICTVATRRGRTDRTLLDSSQPIRSETSNSSAAY